MNAVIAWLIDLFTPRPERPSASFLQEQRKGCEQHYVANWDAQQLRKQFK